MCESYEIPIFDVIRTLQYGRTKAPTKYIIAVKSFVPPSPRIPWSCINKIQPDPTVQCVQLPVFTIHHKTNPMPHIKIQIFPAKLSLRMVPGVFWNKLSFESLLGCCGLLVGCLLKLTVKLYAAPPSPTLSQYPIRSHIVLKKIAKF